MAIIRFTNNFNEVPEGAPNVRFQAPGFDIQNDGWLKTFGPYVCITYDTYVGLCLRDYERNGYDDSDFHMVVWDAEAGKPIDICFASTRGWSYPSYASRPDATPEVVEAYEAWAKVRARKFRICDAWAKRNEEVKIARAIGEDNYRNLAKLKAVVPAGQWKATVDLLTNPRVRSEFKKSLKAQILAWYRDPSPKYETPLSRKQWNYV